VLLRQGDVASARSAFVTALETEPRVEAFVGLALCEQRSGDLAAALRVVESGKQRHPRHAELLYREAVLCFRTSRSEAAERACRGYLDQRSDDASVWELLGLVIEQRDQPRAGVEALTRAVELDPGAGVLCHRGLVRK